MCTELFGWQKINLKAKNPDDSMHENTRFDRNRNKNGILRHETPED